MIGRAALDRPYLFAQADQRIYRDSSTPLSSQDVLLAYHAYACERVAAGDPAPYILRHSLNLFTGERGARHFKRTLSLGLQRGEGPDLLLRALDARSAQPQQHA
jgi:tRNA-dihydrouridine synthase A